MENHYNQSIKLINFTFIFYQLQVSIQIGEETREHNKFLKQVDGSMDSAWGSLSLNMDHVKKLARGGHNRIVFYLLAFVLFVMIVIYMISRSL